MLARVNTFAVDGVEARRVWVEADIRLRAAGVHGRRARRQGRARGARARAGGACVNSGFEFPPSASRSTSRPPTCARSGRASTCRSPCARARGQRAARRPRRSSGCAVVGELSLTRRRAPGPRRAGRRRGRARATGSARLVLPARRARARPRWSPGSRCSASSDAAGGRRRSCAASASRRRCRRRRAGRGRRRRGARPRRRARPQRARRRRSRSPRPAATTCSCTARPGTGKTMLARRLPVDPAAAHARRGDRGHAHPLDRRAARRRRARRRERPFRAPHHTISASGLVGGGAPPAPGEATLAHHGVLFLDELSEFARPALEALRQPLEDGRVTIVARPAARWRSRRASCSSRPSNPCPCGARATARCRCTAADLARHHRRLSGPLLDRIDVLGRASAARRPTALRGEAGAALGRRPRAGRRRPRTPGRAAAPARAQLQRPADARLLRELATHARARCGCSTSSTTATALSARGHGRVLRVARTSPTSTGATRSAPSTSHAGRRPPARRPTR